MHLSFHPEKLGALKQIFHLIWPQFRWFVLGLAVFYVLLFVLAFLQASSFTQKTDARLPTEVVSVEDELVSEPDPVLIEKPPVSLGALVEKSAAGDLPRIGTDGLTPFEAYRAKVDMPPLDQPVISFVIHGLGQSASASRALLESAPAGLSFVISPYLIDAEHWVRAAKDKGHEVWLEVPFETDAYPAEDSGPQTILRRSSTKLNIDRLVWALSRAGGYAGIYGEVGETFLYSDALIVTLFQEIFGRGLGYIESAVEPFSYVETIAVKFEAPYLHQALNLMGPLDEQIATLDYAVQMAKAEGRALVGVDLTPALAKHITTLFDYVRDHDAALAPASMVDLHHWRQIKQEALSQ